MKAARRYREPGNHGFLAYAVPTITGELKRHFRDHSWVVRPPRTIQEARLKFRQVRPELTQRLGRDPSCADLSLAAGMALGGNHRGRARREGHGRPTDRSRWAARSAPGLLMGWTRSQFGVDAGRKFLDMKSVGTLERKMIFRLSRSGGVFGKSGCSKISRLLRTPSPGPGPWPTPTPSRAERRCQCSNCVMTCESLRRHRSRAQLSVG